MMQCFLISFTNILGFCAFICKKHERQHGKRNVSRTPTHCFVMGVASPVVLPIFKVFWDRAERGSYGEWQEPVLAIFKVSRDRAERGSYGKWQEPVLAIYKVTRDRAERGSYGEWQEPVLAIFKACRHRLKGLVMGSGKNRFLPFWMRVTTGWKG